MEYYELDWRKAFEPKPCGIVYGVTTKSLLTLSPMMATGVAIIVGVGAFAIVMARVEKRLAQKDDPFAEKIPWIAKGVLMIGFAAGFIYFVLKNPLWGL
ncbi:hypothetical protein NOM01_04625 [Sporolactobacillus sp. STSJ-5]|uniref:hypothetical protein n=1 Tax=Sporolactobacillus sp. STSJ-5 TaxID=2965076 RepID=UPI0021076FBA|nr:hypothetical protein [Sporolactobacillus sp. STSJ-5]MCQ2009279.1 hypothetical protein [Sporolactobacillus sp. STSJ-5]